VVARDRAGNTRSVSSTYTIIPSAPGISAAITGPFGQNGWHVGNASLTWFVISSVPLTEETGCGPVTVTSDTAGTSFTCRAGNVSGTVSQSVTVRRDATAPEITIATPNGGTYPQGASIAAAYVCSDGTSGVASCTGTVANGALLDTTTLGTRTIEVLARDLAGNTRSASASYTVVEPPPPPPVVAPVANGTLGQNGWYVGNVALSWSIQSSLPITATAGCGPVTVSVNTAPAGLTYTCSATNASGTTAQSITIRRDNKVPTAKATAQPAANGAGWRRVPVTVTFTGTDPHSGIASCTAPTVLASEGTAQSASGSCVDNAGHASALVTARNINIDLTLPTVDLATPAQGAVYPQGSFLTAEYSCSDALSGVAACTGTLPGGSIIDTSRVRTNATFTVTGRDAAGNVTKVTRTYSVR
jgi:hypothetical protein